MLLTGFGTSLTLAYSYPGSGLGSLQPASMGAAARGPLVPRLASSPAWALRLLGTLPGDRTPERVEPRLVALRRSAPL